MRFVIALSVAAIALAACDRAPVREAATGCSLSATHQVTWSSAAAPDVITATAEGPSCGQAAVTLVVRNAGGDPLWTFASTHYAMTAGDSPPIGALPEVSDADMQQFLAGWANVSEMQTSTLPEWRADAPSLTESATTFSYDTPFDREVYEAMRARNLPMLCFAAAAEASQCLIIDPANGAPAMIVAFGP